jgi:hypothetical protein
VWRKGPALGGYSYRQAGGDICDTIKATNNFFGCKRTVERSHETFVDAYIADIYYDISGD